MNRARLRIGSLLLVIAFVAVLLAMIREPANRGSHGLRIARSVMADRAAKPNRLPRLDNLDVFLAMVLGTLSVRAFYPYGPRASRR